MELNDLVLLGCVNVILSVLVSSVCVYVAFGLRSRDVNEAFRRIESLENSIRGQISGNRRAEKAERMQSAMVEVAAIMKNDQIADKQKAIMDLAMKYPDLVGELIRKGI